MTSCGPQRAEVTFHVDEDVCIKRIIIAKTTSAITIYVFEEYRFIKEDDLVDLLLCLKIYEMRYGL